MGNFVAFKYDFHAKLGTTSSAVPTSVTGLTAVYNINDASVQTRTDVKEVINYDTPQGYKKKLAGLQDYSIPMELTLDVTDAGYRLLRGASGDAASGVTLCWYRKTPITDGSTDDAEVLAGVSFVTNFQEKIKAGDVSACSFNLDGYGAPLWYPQGRGIATLTVTTAGSGLTAGTAIPLVGKVPTDGNGSGLGATATLVVTGNAVTSATVVAKGANYKVGDTLTVTSSTVLTGASAVAPVFTVATVS